MSMIFSVQKFLKDLNNKLELNEVFSSWNKVVLTSYLDKNLADSLLQIAAQSESIQVFVLSCLTV